MFDRLNPAVQQRSRIGGHYRHRFLGNDRPMIDMLIDEMNRDTSGFHTICQGILDGVSTGKSRQQRGMNVQNRIGESLDGFFGEYPHESGQNHQLDAVAVKGFANRGRKRRSIRVVGPVDHFRWDSEGLRPQQTTNTVPI